VVAETVGTASTRVHLKVAGLDKLVEGQTYGAHVHTGQCVAGDGVAAGPHYNTGGAPSPTTEVWLDFIVGRGGVADSETVVPFRIPAGAAHSVVVHALPTDATGFAGPRIGCLSVEF
jgi:hypothetical protein